MSLAPRRTLLIVAAAVLASVTIAYSNHFENALQFDDFHVIQDNIYIRSLANIPKFFTDPATQSLKAENRTWRPLVMVSLAVDYWLGNGLKSTFYFHLSTFLWYLLQLVLMFYLYARILDRYRPDPSNFWIAWFAVAWYGLHPAMAETVNYIVQRAEVLSTVGVVAALLVYVSFPQCRRHGLYLALFAVATLLKAPTLIFPVILLAYNFLFEERASWSGFWAAAKKSVPSVCVAAALVWLQRAMTPPSFQPANRPTAYYLLPQPYVVLRYFRSFFLPTHLSADSDLGAIPAANPSAPEIALGFAFVAALLYGIYFTAKRTEMRPIAFGLIWFVAALAPTSLFPLSELENDHRMFFPFVGLMLAATWAGSLALLRKPFWQKHRGVALGALGCLLLVCAVGVHRRNEVWRTEESLWRDVVVKSPMNPRALTNYASALMDRGAYQEAVPYLERSEKIFPVFAVTQASIGIALTGMGRADQAEPYFLRAIQLNPQSAEMHFYYARWLIGRGQAGEAAKELLTSLHLSPTYSGSRYLLLQIYAEHGQWDALRSFAQECLALNPGDPVVQRYLGAEQQFADQVAALEAQAQKEPTADNLMQLSAGYQLLGKYPECIAAAKQAIQLRPNFAEAYNNMAAGYASLRQWDNAIEAARQALRIKPDFQSAQSNLAFAEAQKSAAGGR